MWLVMLSSMFQTNAAITTTHIVRYCYLLVATCHITNARTMYHVSVLSKCHIARSQLNCLLMSRFDWVFFFFFIFVRKITLEHRNVYTKCSSFVCISKVILYYIQSFCYFHSLFLFVFAPPLQSTLYVLFNTNTYEF